ncbi:MAG: hypothetical protein Q8R36_04950 [bacterium]|nr:hypothetical protein [bacterium]
MSQKIKNTIFIIVFVAIVFVAYSLFFKKDDVAPLLTSQSATQGGRETSVVQEFLVLLNTLNNLELDTGIFQDPVFNSLQDESVELQEEPKGRKNPFAPL